MHTSENILYLASWHYYKDLLIQTNYYLLDSETEVTLLDAPIVFGEKKGFGI